MSDNKKYYYMRLKEDFFNAPELKTIEKMRGGYKYSNILLKLYLLSLRDEGRLRLRKNIPYDISMLANLTGFSKTEVENALKIFREFELIEILDSGTIYMLDIQNYIGTSSTEADRQREYDRRVKDEKCKKSNKKSNSISTPEIDIDIDLKPKIESTRNAPHVFCPPTKEEAAAYFKERGFYSSPETFMNYYTAIGWKTNSGGEVQNWRALADLWESREKSKPEEQDRQTGNLPNLNQKRPANVVLVSEYRGPAIGNEGDWVIEIDGVGHRFPDSWIGFAESRGESIEEYVRRRHQ